jgi:hypothetical protein
MDCHWNVINNDIFNKCDDKVLDCHYGMINDDILTKCDDKLIDWIVTTNMINNDYNFN